MKDGLINIKDEGRQEQRRLDINDNAEHHLNGDDCLVHRSDMHGSKSHRGSPNKIIKMLLIIISQEKELCQELK